MTDNPENSGNLADDMAEYLQTFLDETEEQLDDLVETMLALEHDATNADDLNEAFRLIHSIKGSAGMMGFDNITVLTHHLENRFERFRSGMARLDEPTMNLVLRCVDFLRQCNDRLRNSQPLGTATELLAELKRLEEQALAASPKQPPPTVGQEPLPAAAAAARSAPASRSLDDLDVSDAALCMIVRFRAGLQLADLKAQLIVTRLSGLGDVKSTAPDLDQPAEVEELVEFKVWIESHVELDRLAPLPMSKVSSRFNFRAPPSRRAPPSTAPPNRRRSACQTAYRRPGCRMRQAARCLRRQQLPAKGRANRRGQLQSSHRQSQLHWLAWIQPAGRPSRRTWRVARNVALPRRPASRRRLQPTAPASTPAAEEKPATKFAETMRVDIDRLDNLMNLAGELVVNRARFVQISGQISPALRKASSDPRNLGSHPQEMRSYMA